MSSNRMGPPGRPYDPFSEAEKLKLLTDIVKSSGLPSQALLRIIIDNKVRPEWNDIPLPEGRTVNQCQLAFQEMVDGYSRTGQTQSPSYMEPRYEQYPTSAGSMPPQSQGFQSHGFYQSPVDRTLPAMRTLQPRPTSYHAPPPLDPTVQPYAPIINEPPAKRRGRGRPSKADIEAEKRAAEARGEDYPPPKSSRKRTNQDLPSPHGFTQTGSSASSMGPEQSAQGQGPYISPVEYTLSRGEQLNRDPRDSSRPSWAETVGFMPSSSTSSNVRPDTSSGSHHLPQMQQAPQYPNTPRIVAAQQQQQRTHSPSPHAPHRSTGGQ